MAALIVVAGALVYGNSLSAPFLFDDQNSLIGNTSIRQLSPLSVPLSPPRDTPVAGRPIVNLSFAVNYAIGGLDPWGYHVVNVGIHVIAALLLFGVVRRTLTLPALAPRFGGASSHLALVCALAWMLHPLQTESVNYLSQRTESLMGSLYLATLYCAIRARQRRGTRWALAAVAACALGMASKESMVTAPVIVLLFDRVFVFTSWREGLRERGRLYAGLASTWVVLAALMASTPRTSVGFSAGTSPVTYLLNQFQMIAQYLWLAIWPRALVLDYGVPQPLAFADVAPQAALVVGLGLATIAALALRPAAGFLGAWFFITLAPTTSFVPIATEVGAERRMYLPLAGLVVLAVVGCYAFACGAGLVRPAGASPAGLAPHAKRSWIPAIAALCVCLLLAAGTVIRNREYSSRLSIARTIVDRWPNGRGHFLLGAELLEAGQRAEGMGQLRASARDYPGARYALGTELLAEGKLDESIDQLQAFIRALPDHANVAPARDMLGRAYVAQRRLDLAEEQLDLLLRAHPDYPLREQVRALLLQIRNARRGFPG